LSEYPRDRVTAPFVCIAWYGHSMFLVTDDRGTAVLTDPYDPQIGYAFPDLEATLVLVSHEHYDHANVGAVKGSPEVVRSPGRRVSGGGLEIEGLPSAHDAREGAERGPNTIFRWSMAGMGFAHLGDLGHRLDSAQLEGLRGVDVLFLPVGGTFTIDDAQAEETVRSVAPRIAIPMHYKTAALGFPIQGVQPFADRFEDVVLVGKDLVYLDRQALPETTRVLVLDYLG
jgi:L-ascorbate metabolism protein UlaG (beta-lactamase superfamily)